ncbi:hypothetical protein ABZ931_21735, partial [Streptomyces neyagawaensis]
TRTVVDVPGSHVFSAPPVRYLRAAVGSVICGAMTSEQVTANAAAADWIPSPADLAALDAIVAPGERVV